MKKILLITLFFSIQYSCVFAQLYRGKIMDTQGRSLQGATIKASPENKVIRTDSSGIFSFEKRNNSHILISMLGFKTETVTLGKNSDLGKIQLTIQNNELEEVIVNTGYYQLNKNRLTGSFSTVDQATLQRNPATHILDRLEGVTSGLQFDRSLNTGENNTLTSFRIRGVSSIESSTAPLIILDNFPFEGDMNSINPNDIESVTVLKDAAAAAIWGAKAGNGVIVLTSKVGRFGEPLKMSFTSNWKLSSKPDLFYNRKYIPSKDMMEVEDFLYSKGFYYLFDNMYMPDYAAMLFQKDKGQLSDEEFQQKKDWLVQQDIRKDAQEHLYQKALTQSYALQIRGGAQNQSYFISGAYDKEREAVVGNKNNRVNLNLDHNLKLYGKINLNTYLRYSGTHTQHNGYNLQALLASGGTISPYTHLMNTDGTYASLNYQYNHTYRDEAMENGLLDWRFNPLLDRDQRDITSTSRQITAGTGLQVNLGAGISVDLKYRYLYQIAQSTNLYGADSYYVRNLVNMYTQSNGTRIIPIGQIKDGQQSAFMGHNGRFQLNWNRKWSADHELVALVGAEISQNITSQDVGYRLYGYRDDNGTFQNNMDYKTQYTTKPLGQSTVPDSPYDEIYLIDRFVSYFANGSYLFKKNHAVSASLRWDASNLFGVKTNQKGVPLWSLGLSEQLLPYVKDYFPAFEKLTLRATYGFSGNVNKSVSAYPAIRIDANNFVNGLPFAAIQSAGNPNLRWEKLATYNLGLDFSVFKNRVTGSFDYYIKSGKDLIGPTFVDPSTGISADAGVYYIDNRINYANLRTDGLDINLHLVPVTGDFVWKADLLWSWTKNRVTKYMANSTLSMSALVSSPQPRKGYSLDAFYAWDYNGLSPDNGQILTANHDQNYASYIANATWDDVMYMGVDFPPYQGSLRNTFQYRGFELSANMEWKNGFYFRRNSIDYNKLFQTTEGHQDFLNRWKQMGDEKLTYVPALPATIDRNRDNLYTNSRVLVEKGDFLRLSDMRFSYRFQPKKSKKVALNTFVYLQNLAVLYRANKVGLDPEAVKTNYPARRTYTVGIQLEW